MHKTFLDFVFGSKPKHPLSHADDGNGSPDTTNNPMPVSFDQAIMSCRSAVLEDCKESTDNLLASQGRDRVLTLFGFANIIPKSVLTALASIASSHASGEVRSFAASLLPQVADMAIKVALAFAKLGDPTYARQLMQNFQSIRLFNFQTNKNCPPCNTEDIEGDLNIDVQGNLDKTVRFVTNTEYRAERIVRDKKDRGKIVHCAEVALYDLGDQISKTSDPNELAWLRLRETQLLGQIFSFNA